MSAESNWRTSSGQFRWSANNSRPAPLSQPVATVQPTTAWSRVTAPLKGIMGTGYNALNGAGSSGQAGGEEEEAWLTLSRWDRLLVFLGCLVGASVCFFVAFFSLPFLVLRPTKFALAFSLGSLLVMMGLAVLQGPVNQVKALMVAERLPFTCAYLGSLGLTIYFAVGPRLKIATLIFAVIQITSLLYFIVSFFPGGSTTLRFGSMMALRRAGSVLPM